MQYVVPCSKIEEVDVELEGLEILQPPGSSSKPVLASPESPSPYNLTSDISGLLDFTATSNLVTAQYLLTYGPFLWLPAVNDNSCRILSRIIFNYRMYIHFTNVPNDGNLRIAYGNSPYYPMQLITLGDQLDRDLISSLPEEHIRMLIVVLNCLSTGRKRKNETVKLGDEHLKHDWLASDSLAYGYHVNQYPIVEVILSLATIFVHDPFVEYAMTFCRYHPWAAAVIFNSLSSSPSSNISTTLTDNSDLLFISLYKWEEVSGRSESPHENQWPNPPLIDTRNSFATSCPPSFFVSPLSITENEELDIYMSEEEGQASKKAQFKHYAPILLNANERSTGIDLPFVTLDPDSLSSDKFNRYVSADEDRPPNYSPFTNSPSSSAEMQVTLDEPPHIPNINLPSVESPSEFNICEQMDSNKKQLVPGAPRVREVDLPVSTPIFLTEQPSTLSLPTLAPGSPTPTSRMSTPEIAKHLCQVIAHQKSTKPLSSAKQVLDLLRNSPASSSEFLQTPKDPTTAGASQSSTETHVLCRITSSNSLDKMYAMDEDENASEDQTSWHWLGWDIPWDDPSHFYQESIVASTDLRDNFHSPMEQGEGILAYRPFLALDSLFTYCYRIYLHVTNEYTILE